MEQNKLRQATTLAAIAAAAMINSGNPAPPPPKQRLATQQEHRQEMDRIKANRKRNTKKQSPEDKQAMISAAEAKRQRRLGRNRAQLCAQRRNYTGEWQPHPTPNQKPAVKGSVMMRWMSQSKYKSRAA